MICTNGNCLICMGFALHGICRPVCKCMQVLLQWWLLFLSPFCLVSCHHAQCIFPTSVILFPVIMPKVSFLHLILSVASLLLNQSIFFCTLFSSYLIFSCLITGLLISTSFCCSSLNFAGLFLTAIAVSPSFCNPFCPVFGIYFPKTTCLELTVSLAFYFSFQDLFFRHDTASHVEVILNFILFSDLLSPVFICFCNYS
jgi:hypothetical protein